MMLAAFVGAFFAVIATGVIIGWLAVALVKWALGA